MLSTKAFTNVGLKPIILGLVVLFVGGLVIHSAIASTTSTSSEAENGTLSSCANTVSDASASGSSAVKFATCGDGSSNPSANAGASLPISYSLSSLTGTVEYVSPSGSDSGSGSVSSPYATLAKAISVAPSGGTIVLRGGTYRGQGNLTINKSLKIIAYPGETPIFNGATAVSGGWTASGSLSYRSYTPMPVTNGSGISFTGCQNQTSSCMGQYPDQAWVGSPQLQQVGSQSAVTAGKFWVDETNNRLYMATSDVNQGNIEVSNQRTFANITASNVTLEGFEVVRYSNTASDFGVINVQGTASNMLMDNMFMTDMSFIGIQVLPTGSTLNANSTIQNSSIIYGNWMGVGLTATNYFTFDHDNIGNMNQFNEFTSSPQSGSIKTGRTWYTTVINSKFMNNNTVGIWFDQSNYKVTVAGNDIENNTGTGLFFEISDYLYAVNNYIKGNGANGIEISGSSDAYLVNNTIVGNYDQVAVYVDSRSIPGCSDPAQPLCSGSYNSDRDTYHTHPATMTWIPTINLFLNNVFAYPAGTRYCGPNANLCITSQNGSATDPINNVIHPADASTGVPQTLMDGDVYANGSGPLILTSLGNFSSLSAFSSAMAGSPVNISGFEAHGLTGNQYVNSDGSPTSALQSQMSNAAAVPTSSYINPYVPAGTKHYGVTWQ